jgi:hypothetical protein
MTMAFCDWPRRIGEDVTIDGVKEKDAIQEVSAVRTTADAMWTN